MRSFKKGQNVMKGILKTFLSTQKDNPEYEQILYALNSGKRIASIICGALSTWTCPNDCLLAIEFIHTSQILISDMYTKQQTRRTKECFYIKYGDILTYKLSAWFQHQALKRLPNLNEHICNALSYDLILMNEPADFVITQRKMFESKLCLCRAKSRLFQAAFSINKLSNPYAGEILGTMFYATMMIDPKELVNTAQNMLTDLMFNYPSKNWPTEIREMVQTILSKIKN